MIADEVTQHYLLPFELRQFQKDVVEELAQFERSGMFMDVGTGKTVVSTVLGLYKGLRGEVDQMLVLMPPIILNQWRDWLVSLGLEVTVYRGTPTQRKNLELEADAVLMTFNIFKNDYVKLTRFFLDRRVFVVVDEAAAIRRPRTQIFKAVRDFMGMPNKQLTMLTGTAINRLHHCYGYIALKTPGVYRNYKQFELLHINSVDIFGEPVVYNNVDLLASNLMLQSVKVSADDVLDLPPVVYSPVVYELEPAHQRLYNRVVEEQLVILDNGEILDATVAQRMYHTCQRVILMPSLFGGEKISPNAFALIEATADEMGMFSGAAEKMVVYVNYTASNEAVFAYCQTLKGLGPLQAYGKLGAAKNLKNLERFLTDSAVNILVAHPGSVGIGINLQHVCRVIIFLELPITSNVFTQAIGRIYREGQKKSCVVKMAIAANTIQMDLKRRVVAREDEMQQVMPTKQSLRKALTGGVE